MKKLLPGILLLLLFSTHLLAAKMPTKVDVNGVTWRIQIVPRLASGSAGFTRCDLKVIFLSRESIAPKTIVMHELTHAAVCTDAKGDFLPDNMYYNSVTPEDHEGIYAFTEIWGELLYRNPKLGKWLASH